jgi:hypothetical protein
MLLSSVVMVFSIADKAGRYSFQRLER